MRFVVAVGAADCTYPAPHTVTLPQTRSVDAVAAVIWYCIAVQLVWYLQLDRVAFWK